MEYIFKLLHLNEAEDWQKTMGLLLGIIAIGVIACAVSLLIGLFGGAVTGNNIPLI